jgi:hypothetical protein
MKYFGGVATNVARLAKTVSRKTLSHLLLDAEGF